MDAQQYDCALKVLKEYKPEEGFFNRLKDYKPEAGFSDLLAEVCLIVVLDQQEKSAKLEKSIATRNGCVEDTASRVMDLDRRLWALEHPDVPPKKKLIKG